MRYGNPSIRSALESLRNQGVTRLLLAPLFPHYAQATTESSVKHAYNELNDMNWTPEILELGHFETESEFVDPLLNPFVHILAKIRTFSFRIMDYPSRMLRELTHQKSIVKRWRIVVKLLAMLTPCAMVDIAVKPLKRWLKNWV